MAITKRLEKKLVDSPFELQNFIYDRFPIVLDAKKTVEVYKQLQILGRELENSNSTYLGMVVSGSRAKGIPASHSDLDLSVLVTENYSSSDNLVEQLLQKVNVTTGVKTILNDLNGGILGNFLRDNRKDFLNSKIAVRLDSSLIKKRVDDLMSSDFLRRLDGRYSLLTSFGNIVHSSEKGSEYIERYKRSVKEFIALHDMKGKIYKELNVSYQHLFIGMLKPIKGLDPTYTGRLDRLREVGLNNKEISELLRYRIEMFGLHNYFPKPLLSENR